MKKLLTRFILSMILGWMLLVAATNTQLYAATYEENYEASVQIRTWNGTGSGFYVAESYVVTNAHVVQDGFGYQELVKVWNGAMEYQALVVGYNRGLDIAILYTPFHKNVSVDLGKSDWLKVQDHIYTIGSPFGVFNTVTKGMITGLNRNVQNIPPYTGYMQISAGIAPGSSGSAVFDMSGNVIAVVNSGYKGYEFLSFAIPINKVRSYISTTILMHGINISDGEHGEEVKR